MRISQDAKQKAEEFAKSMVGFAVLAAIGWGIWTFALKGDDAEAAIGAEDPSLTLADYATLSDAARADRIGRAVAGIGAPADDIPAFTRCMGDMAKAKAGELRFDEVFSWCDKERHNDRAAFEAHFNELAAKDLSMDAIAICQDAVRWQLIAPGSAKFPLLDYSVFALKRQRYVVKSHVDSQNIFGARQRTSFHCDVQHDNRGDRLDGGSWTVHELELL